MNNPFYYKNNRLYCEQIDLEKFASTVTTPFYLYSQAEIEYNCNSVWQAAGQIPIRPFYALKANFNPSLLKLILKNNFGADIVSGGELYFARKAGFLPEQIVFAGVGKTDGEISQALEENIHSINIESEEELHRVAQLAKVANKKQRIAIRINPEIDAKTHPYISTALHSSKFGVFPDRAYNLYQQASKYPELLVEGIHVHIGSQITDDGPYLETAQFLIDFINRLKKIDIDIKYLDLGGGIGIDYNQAFSNTEKPRTYISNILRKWLNAFNQLNMMLFIELGRSIVGSAGVLVTQVILNKKSARKNFIITDAGMNNLIRPSLYQAKHEIVPLVKNDRSELTTDIVGPVCESADFLAKEYVINETKAKEYLAVGSTGAYAQVQASNYNLRPTIAEYLVNGSQVKCIFKGNSIEKIAENFEW